MAFYQMLQCWPFNAINPSLFAEFLTLIRKFIIILLLLTRKNYCNINYNNNNNNNNNSNNNNNNNNNNYKECTNLKSQFQRNVQYCFSSSPVFIIMVMILCETCAYPIHGGGVSASVHIKQTRSIADLYVNRHHTHHQHQQKHQYQHHNISTSSSTSSLSSAASLSSTIAAASMAARDLTSIENDGDMTDFIAASPSSSSSSSSSLSRHLQLGTKENTGCPSTTSSHCLRCNSEGCIKCPVFLVTDTRQCVERCPAGYIDQWSAHTEFMGRVCVTTGYSGALMAALAGMFGGFLICLSILAIAVMVMKRRRRRKTIKQKLINENSMDRSDFLRQLNEMRPNAEYFLAMLNDTRRQIRKLYLSGDIVAANSYRPIVRDLARILILLNRPIELIPGAPHDWNRLYSWSEQVLERYRPQVGQLIDFFQTPGHVGVDVDEFDAHSVYRQKAGGGGFYRQSPLQSTSNLTTTTSNTIKSQKMHIFGSLISLHEFEEPRPSDPFGSSFNTLKNGNLITDLNASSLWLEDEFYKLGFRPQDEITTEL